MKAPRGLLGADGNAGPYRPPQVMLLKYAQLIKKNATFEALEEVRNKSVLKNCTLSDSKFPALRGSLLFAERANFWRCLSDSPGSFATSRASRVTK